MLESPTLVLNRVWVPVNVTSAKEAIVLVCAGRARFVCPHTYAPHDLMGWIDRGVVSGRAVRAVRFEIEAPEVVVLTDFDHVPPREVSFSRKNLYRRDEMACQYCGKRLRGEVLTIDHVHPLSRGGDTSWENCVLACHRCNSRKADRTPQEARMGLRRSPRRPKWSPKYATYTRDNRPPSWDNFLMQAVAR